MIDPSPFGVGRQKYYLKQIAHDREAYLTGHGEAPGYALGTAAPEALGLSGQVSAEVFERLFAGRHPDSGALLGCTVRAEIDPWAFLPGQGRSNSRNGRPALRSRGMSLPVAQIPCEHPRFQVCHTSRAGTPPKNANAATCS
ncbi:MAG: relaxase domain-containing protein [Egibacteraceae bacterium]